MAPPNQRGTGGGEPPGGNVWDDLSHTLPVNVMPLDRPGSAAAVPCLVVISGDQMGQVFPLSTHRARIGRSEEAEIRIRETSVSRHHATAWLDEQGRCFVEDLDSTNGTFVNGERITWVQVSPGDRVQVGNEAILKLELHGNVERQFHEQLYDAGTRDPLTGTFNRRYLDQHLEADFNLAVRHSEALSILMVDIDHFKQVNDTLGHPAGDEVLRQVAEKLSQRIRHEDILARYGGEEFVIASRRTSRDGALRLAESLRQLVEKAEVRYRGEKVGVTISIGVATIDEENDLESAAALVARVDDALYRAKDEGRNRVEVAWE